MFFTRIDYIIYKYMQLIEEKSNYKCFMKVLILYGERIKSHHE